MRGRPRDQRGCCFNQNGNHFSRGNLSLIRKRKIGLCLGYIASHVPPLRGSNPRCVFFSSCICCVGNKVRPARPARRAGTKFPRPARPKGRDKKSEARPPGPKGRYKKSKARPPGPKGRYKKSKARPPGPKGRYKKPEARPPGPKGRYKKPEARPPVQ